MKADSQVKILLVDDRAENLFALEVIFYNENYLCVKANSGKEALEILEHEQDFAIILMDVQMPKMDGYETVELIRKIETMKHVPIIFLTASMDNSVQVFKGYLAGAVDYMIKPLLPAILKAKVAVFVDLYRKNEELLVQAEQMKALNSDIDAQKLLAKYSLSLIEASHDPLFAISPEGKITDLNNASIKVTGVSREKLMGTNFIDYFTEPEKAKEVYQKIFSKGFAADYPLTIIDEKLTNVLLNGSVYKNEQGTVVGVVVVARDVTAQKNFENELIEAKKNAERAKIMAEDTMQSKQQFLSNMSHEIRTPMNAIIGFTKVVLKTDLNSKQKEYLNAIRESGDTLIVLINDILDLAKVDAGKMTFEKAPFTMANSISSMLRSFETKIQEKNLELVKEYDENIPEILIGDSQRLHQIILNLVSNAIKFTSKGKIIVSVRLLKEDDEYASLEFAVTDTGIGISSDKITTIFENFQQASSDTTKLYGGTGLGLAIAKQLVERQNGSIHVKSKMGVGSTFSFILTFQKTFPIAIGNEKDTENYQEVKLNIEADDKHMGKEINNIKVLVAEDNIINQLLMDTLLNNFEFEHEIAGNGKIAIEKLQTNFYDIILMDLQMPEMDGYECSEYIRNVMNSKIPIIAVTANVTTADLAKCMAIGMNDYIAKPIDEKILYNKIVELVKNSNTTQSQLS